MVLLKRLGLLLLYGIDGLESFDYSELLLDSSDA